jgi:hypothetical protein
MAILPSNIFLLKNSEILKPDEIFVKYSLYSKLIIRTRKSKNDPLSVLLAAIGIAFKNANEY